MEIETPFLVLVNNSRTVIEQINHVIENNKYDSIQADPIAINDTYYDTVDKDLKRNNINLRTRKTNNKNTKVTLKRQRESKQDYFDRIEIEESWSHPIYNKILAELKSIRVQFDKRTDTYDENPEQTFENMGLETIMIKRSKRTVINAVNNSTKQTEFELAFDQVSVSTKPQDSIGFLELEIESKIKGNQQQFDKFVDNFTKRNDLFKHWSHNKLETGLALISLKSIKKLEKTVDYDDGNFLTKKGIEKLESYLTGDKS